jgi:DNA polymerase I-like protein with 3'-5' exonuclease and polymerase domains
LQIHDELLFEVDEAFLPDALALIDHAMTTIDSRLKVCGLG